MTLKIFIQIYTKLVLLSVFLDIDDNFEVVRLQFCHLVFYLLLLMQQAWSIVLPCWAERAEIDRENEDNCSPHKIQHKLQSKLLGLLATADFNW